MATAFADERKPVVTEDNSPATKRDLAAMEERLTEKMRDMQTGLLRGFAAFSEGQTICLRELEAD